MWKKKGKAHQSSIHCRRFKTQGALKPSSSMFVSWNWAQSWTPCWNKVVIKKRNLKEKSYFVFYLFLFCSRDKRKPLQVTLCPHDAFPGVLIGLWARSVGGICTRSVCVRKLRSLESAPVRDFVELHGRAAIHHHASESGWRAERSSAGQRWGNDNKSANWGQLFLIHVSGPLTWPGRKGVCVRARARTDI